MVNYSKGKIYKIEPIVPHLVNEVYYGSTTKQYLCQRWNTHKLNYQKKVNHCSVITLFDKYGITNCSITLVELYPCNSRDELFTRETLHIKNNECINKYLPIRSRADYYIDNKEKIKKDVAQYQERNKEKIKKDVAQYQERNKEKIKERVTTLYTCECGSIIQKRTKSSHEKTKKHIGIQIN
jgi:hypothetical protein